MNKILFTLFTLLYFSISESKTSWIGEWLALDEWQSEFSIIIKNDGSTMCDVCPKNAAISAWQSLFKEPAINACIHSVQGWISTQ